MTKQNDNPQILIVDDSPNDLRLICEMLRDRYRVVTATSGEEAIKVCNRDTPPKLILLDVSMPGINGYETCKILKADLQMQNIGIIFVSANDTDAEKLKGFELGAIDYLTKPVHPTELLQKIERSIDIEYKIASASEETQAAMDTAMQAIMDAGEQASIVHFLQRSFACQSFADLAVLVVETTSIFELSSSVQIRTPHGHFESSSSGQVPPIELEIFKITNELVRIHQQGRRLIMSFGPISQLIRNLPSDEVKVGRLRDHLAIILEGAVSRIQHLLVNHDLKMLMDETQTSLMRVKKLQSQQKQHGIDLVDELMSDIHTKFINYGLTEEQEHVITCMIERFADKSFAAFEEGLKVDDELNNIALKVKQSLEHAHYE